VSADPGSRRLPIDRGRDGRTCDECGGPNYPPRGWLHDSWSRFVDPSLDRGEGYQGLVLCVLCFAGRVEQKAGAEEALAVLQEVLRRHQAFIARMRERQQSRPPAPPPQG
jgi:hypothetical protein